MRFVDVVDAVIEKARLRREAARGVSLDDEDEFTHFEAIPDTTPQPEREALRVYLTALSATDIFKLRTLMVLGRDNPRSLHALHRDLQLKPQSKDDTIRDLVEKVSLDLDLAKGKSKALAVNVDLDAPFGN